MFDADKQLIADARMCQEYKNSVFYGFVNNIMEALEAEALSKLCAARTGDKDQIFALTLRWQERRFCKDELKNQIDVTIANARDAISEAGGDPDEWALRSDIEE